MENPNLSHHIDSNLEILPAQLISTDFKREARSYTIHVSDHYANPLSKIDQLVKRIEDLILGSIALFLFLPLMLIVAFSIRVDTAGPIIFRQTRTGHNRKPIVVYKFRSMKHESNPAFHQAVENDSRVTRVGAFIRRTSLDELPQLINVINGSMSLVGPRPHPLKLDEEFSYVIQSLPARYRVKPGISGLAQIKGYRGETRCRKSMAARIELDRKYIQNWSLLQDIWILMRTTIVGWTHNNAY